MFSPCKDLPPLSPSVQQFVHLSVEHWASAQAVDVLVLIAVLVLAAPKVAVKFLLHLLDPIFKTLSLFQDNSV